MNAPITADEFRIFNRCLDDAIAEAVTEYTRQREQSLTDEGREHLGELAHELRNAVGAAIVSFEVLRMGKVGLEGSTAGVLSRSLRRLAALMDGSLTEVRLESGLQSPERVSVRELIEESAASAAMEANARGSDVPRPGGRGGHRRSGRPAAVRGCARQPAAERLQVHAAGEPCLARDVGHRWPGPHRRSRTSAAGCHRARRPSCCVLSSSGAPTAAAWGWGSPSRARASRQMAACSACATFPGEGASSASTCRGCFRRPEDAASPAAAGLLQPFAS